MPNIPVYQSQVRPRRPSGANAEAAARIGEIQQRTFQQLGQDVRDIGNMIDEQQGKQETSVVSKDWSSEELFLTEDWSKTAAAADPNKIDEVAEQWIEKTLNPRIEAFGANVSSTAGTALRDKLREGMRTTFMRTVYGDRAAITGKAVVTNIDEMGNNNANTARMSPDKMEELIAGTRLAIEEQITAHRRTIGADGAARIRGEVSERIFRNIAMAAALGSAQKNPTEARKALADGKFSPYLTVEQQREVINEIEQQERAAIAEKNRIEADAREQKREQSEAAEGEYVSGIILNPTKVSPKEIANDPRLTGPQKQRIFDNLNQEIKRRSGGDDPDANKGPGFWQTYNRVLSTGPDRIKDADEIYRMAGPGKPLTLQGATALVTLLNRSREGSKVGNFDAERQRSFFNEMHRLVTRDEYGTPRAPSEGYDPESNYFRLYADKIRQIEEGTAKGKTLEQLLDYKSPDYIGKDWKSYVPPEPVDSFEPLPEEKPRTWVDFFGGLLSGGPTPKIEDFDKVQDGKQGLAALKAAVAAGMSKDAAMAYALKRGWVRPDAPKQQVPAAMK